MKHWKLLPFQFLKKARQRGQAVVEFALLLAVMALITYGFTAFMNRNLAVYWKYSINLIKNDAPPPQGEIVDF